MYFSTYCSTWAPLRLSLPPIGRISGRWCWRSAEAPGADGHAGSGDARTGGDGLPRADDAPPGHPCGCLCRLLAGYPGDGAGVLPDDLRSRLRSGAGESEQKNCHPGRSGGSGEILHSVQNDMASSGSSAPEALFAAIYLDGGIEEVRSVIWQVLLSKAPAAPTPSTLSPRNSSRSLLPSPPRCSLA